MDIAKSVILITAAGTPTGRAMAEYFCALGAKLALVDSNQEQLDNTYQACVKQSYCCSSFLLKDRDVKSIYQMFDEIKDKFGRLDVLINYWQTNPLPSLLSDTSYTENTIADVASNLYIFGRCAAGIMIDRGKGVIINIPYIQHTDYTERDLNSSNSVIRGLTLSWGQELEHTKIRVGGLLTPFRYYQTEKISQLPSINYDMIDSIAYIVENDSFTSRVLEIY